MMDKRLIRGALNSVGYSTPLWAAITAAFWSPIAGAAIAVAGLVMTVTATFIHPEKTTRTPMFCHEGTHQ